MTEVASLEPVLTKEDILALPRQEVRYALFRNRTGNPDSSHKAIWDYYAPRLSKWGLDPSSFSTTWDISKLSNDDVVSGHIIGVYQEDLEIFNPDGTLKD